MTYKFKEAVTYIAILLGIILLLGVVFQVLVYAVPVIFIMWAVKWVIGKIKGTVHEHKHKQTIHQEKHKSKDAGIEREKVKYDYYNINKSNVVDVEYEELN
jgi:predicted membrane protein